MSDRACSSIAALVALISIGVAPRGTAPAEEPELVAPTEAVSPEEEQKQFHLPPGFVIQLVAAEPDIYKPMNLNFDVRGRLYVTSSREYPYPAKGDDPKRDIVTRFDAIGTDGRATRSVKIVEGLNIPIGLLPREDSLIYYSIPNIYRAAAAADGHLDAGQVLYGTIGFRDTHGMASSFTRWIDGWVYGCHGFSNDSALSGADGQTVKMSSGNTYRFRADGSHVEQFTHGQVNPFGLSFDPLGNLYSADCHTKPLYMLLRGAWYPSFGKPHDGLGFGPEMIDHLHGSTGIGGVVYYATDHFPPDYRDTVFIGNPVTGRVNHDRLEQRGSTFKAIELADFIRCDDPWFRPVDLKLGPDGALYIADFYNCIIGHYEVPLTHPRRDRTRGRIWRVVYTGEDGRDPAPRAMPDLTTRTPEELVALLGHANLTVRVLATEALQARLAAPGAMDDLRAAVAGTAYDEASLLRRVHALWLVERSQPGGLDLATVHRLAEQPARLVRVHLIKALAERAEWPPDLFALVRAKLHDADPFVRRAAADALGRHPHADNVDPLLALWAETPAHDTHLVHTARMALRDQLLQPGTYERVAAIAAKDNVAARVAEISLGVRTAESADYLLAYLAKHEVNEDQLSDYLHDAARYAKDERFDAALKQAQACTSAVPARQRAAVLAMARAAQERGRPVPDEITAWAGRLTAQLLAGAEQARVRDGIEMARELRVGSAFEPLASLAARSSRFADLRVPAIDACVANSAEQSVPVLSGILSDAAEAMAIRQKAAGALAGMALPAAREVLIEQLRAAPEKLSLEIARGLANTRDGGEALLAEVTAGKASPRLLKDGTIEQRLGSSKVSDAHERIAQLTADLPPVDDRLRKLVNARRKGFGEATADLAAGRAVFLKVCAACHQLGDAGAKIGPGLDGVGLRGLERLLEDTLDPSRNVDQAFRATLINTTGGNAISGLLLREEGEVLVLADNQGKEIRIPAAEVAERSVSQLSPMPANVADVMSDAEYYNLLGFLLEQKQKPEKGP
ncbi:MAG: HEAT repeat domain-containing protein [Planctomycetia bacterium]|nr:HEAT repeat domain-containing protein [Planctomycetia bacterium]